MNINYKIVEVHADSRVMVVRYFTDIITENDLDVSANPKGNITPERCKSDVSLNIPTPEPTEEELHKIILQNAPVSILKNLEMMKTQPNTATLSVVHTMKNKKYTKSEQEIKDMFAPKPLTDAKIKELVDKIK